MMKVLIIYLPLFYRMLVGMILSLKNGVISHRYNPAAHRFIDINMTEKSLNKNFKFRYSNQIY